MGASHKFGSLVADGDTGAAAAELAAQQQQQQAQQQEAEASSSFKSQQKAHSRASKDSLLGRQSKDSMLGDGAAPPTTARASMHIGDSTMDEKELQEAVRARPHVSRVHTREPSHHSYQHLHNATFHALCRLTA